MRHNATKKTIFGLAASGLVMVWSAPLATADAPTLMGLDQNKAIIIPFSVQAADRYF